MEITIRGNPIPWAAPKARAVATKGKKPFAMVYDPQQQLKKSLRSVVQDLAPEKPFTGPVVLNIIAYMKIPKSVSKKKKVLMLAGKIRPTKKPDRTNIQKLYEDLLNGIVYLDDAQVVGGSTEKFYSETPRIEMYAEELSQELGI